MVAAALRLPRTTISVDLPEGWLAEHSEVASVAAGPVGPLFTPTLVALAADPSSSLLDGLAEIPEAHVLSHRRGDGAVVERLRFAYTGPVVALTVDQALLRLTDGAHVVLTGTVGTASLADDWAVISEVIDRAASA